VVKSPQNATRQALGTEMAIAYTGKSIVRRGSTVDALIFFLTNKMGDGKSHLTRMPILAL
jgi:hypothetical protein